jgi:hypothetical protein
MPVNIPTVAHCLSAVAEPLAEMYWLAWQTVQFLHVNALLDAVYVFAGQLEHFLSLTAVPLIEIYWPAKQVNQG